MKKEVGEKRGLLIINSAIQFVCVQKLKEFLYTII